MNRKQIVFAIFIKDIIAIIIGTHLKLNGNEMYFIAISTGVIFQILSLIFYFKPKGNLFDVIYQSNTSRKMDLH